MFLKFLRQKRNKGSALIMVITIVAFVSVLGTTLLYMSGSNYQMKQSDYKTKRVFYLNEEFFDNIRAMVLADASVAAENSFEDVVPIYAKYSNMSAAYTGGSLSEEDKNNLLHELDLFQQKYDAAFRDAFETEWKKHFYDPTTGYSYETGIYNLFADGIVSGSLVSVNPGHYTFKYDEKDETGAVINTVDVDITFYTSSDADTYETDPISVYSKSHDFICPIRIVTTNTDGYSSIIRSAITVKPPMIDTAFATTGSFFKEDISEYVFYTGWTKM